MANIGQAWLSVKVYSESDGDLKQYIKRLERLWIVDGLTMDIKKKNALLAMMPESIVEYYEAVAEDDDSYDVAKEKILKKFDGSQSVIVAHNKLKVFKLDWREDKFEASLLEYGQLLKITAQSLNGEELLAHQISQVTQLVSSEEELFRRLLYKNDYSTYKELVSDLHTTLMGCRRMRAGRSILRSSNNLDGKGGYRFKGQCFWCNERGHRESDCKKKALGFPKVINGKDSGKENVKFMNTGYGSNNSSKGTTSAVKEFHDDDDVAGRSHLAIVKMKFKSNGDELNDRVIVPVMLDTGSTVNLVKDSVINNLGYRNKVKNNSVKLSSAFGDIYQAKGCVSMDIEYDGVKRCDDFLIVDDKCFKSNEGLYDAILGVCTMRDIGLDKFMKVLCKLDDKEEPVKMIAQQIQRNSQYYIPDELFLPVEDEIHELANDDKDLPDDVVQLWHEYKDIVSESEYDLGACSIEVPRKVLNGKEFVRPPRFRYNPVQEKELIKLVKELLYSGILVKKETTFVSNFIMVPSKDGIAPPRFAVDLRNLNSCTRIDSYPTKTASELYGYLQEALFYTSIDIAKSFWQLRLHEDDQMYYGVYTPLGTCCFTRVPFGDVNAMPYWQRIYDRIIREAIGDHGISYVDDLVVYSNSSREQHLELVRRMFDTLRKYNLKIRKKKTMVAQNSIKFLGWIISPQGRVPAKSNTEALKSRKIPKDVKDVKKFLGVVGFFRDAIPQFSRIALPLTEMTKDKNKDKFIWSQEADKSFKELIKLVTNPPILKIPEYHKPFHVYCDSSMLAMGAFIGQVDGSGKLRAVRYYSKKWSYVKREKTINLLELQAIAVTLQENVDILGLGKIYLYTDSKVAKAIIESSVDPMFARYVSYIQAYNIVVVKIKGENNCIADDLSRSVCGVGVLDDHCSDDVFPLPNELFIKKQKEDEFVMKLIADNKLVFLNGVAYKKVLRKEGEESKEILLPIMPRQLVQNYLKAIHDEFGHQGVNKLLLMVRKAYTWENQDRDIAEYVKLCKICQQTKGVQDKHPQFQAIDYPLVPWSVISWDVMGPVKPWKLYVVNVVDNQSSETLISGLLNVFSMFGLPRVIRSDNQASLKSQEVVNLMKKLNVRMEHGIPFHKEGNSLVERSFKTMEEIMKREKLESRVNDLHGLVWRTAWLYNSYPNLTTQKSPYEVLFGRPPHLPQDAPKADVAQVEKGFENFYVQMKIGWEIASQKSKDVRESLNARLDNAGVEIKQYNVGDRVWVYRNLNKTEPQWVGPYTVVSQDGAEVLVRKSNKGRNLRTHVKDLKLVLEDPNSENEKGDGVTYSQENLV
uniref:RNA-directed DNA polymerase n=1 Tax=Strongyloides papillosus TaxID=174720 RepID=A0A0N5C0V0_STREA